MHINDPFELCGRCEGRGLVSTQRHRPPTTNSRRFVRKLNRFPVSVRLQGRSGKLRPKTNAIAVIDYLVARGDCKLGRHDYRNDYKCDLCGNYVRVCNTCTDRKGCGCI